MIGAVASCAHQVLQHDDQHTRTVGHRPGMSWPPHSAHSIPANRAPKSSVAAQIRSAVFHFDPVGLLSMHGTSTSGGANANSPSEAGFGESRSELRLSYELMRVARSLWPRKTAAELAYRTGVSERAAEFWLAGKYAISLEHARRLIQSDHGDKFLAPFLGDARPEWWERLQAMREIAQARTLEAAAKAQAKSAVRRLEQIEFRFGKPSRD